MNPCGMRTWKWLALNCIGLPSIPTFGRGGHWKSGGWLPGGPGGWGGPGGPGGPGGGPGGPIGPGGGPCGGPGGPGCRIGN